MDVITKSFQAKPTADVGRGSEWHIGNVEAIKGGGIAFAMGRTQAVTTPQFDWRTHDFLEEEAMRAPFTVGVFDQDTQVCGIIRKSGVSQNINEIGMKLARLLNSTPYPRDSNSQIVVEPIPDPINFIEAIHSAAAVTRFSFTVSRPNPHDVNRLIQGPAKEFTEKSGGEKTKIEVEGADLDRDLIEDVAKAVAADGEQAAANIKENERSRSKRIYLSGNPVIERVDPGEDKSIFEAILERARFAYRRVRGPVEN
ncbi:hypothetical protein A7X12_09800 [Sphingomonas sp. TDK1]|nr:hypothetical protein A7X12_09800 [Sphingomonas sp. TDK1]